MTTTGKKKQNEAQVISEEFVASYERLVNVWFENISANQIEAIAQTPLKELEPEPCRDFGIWKVQ